MTEVPLRDYLEMRVCEQDRRIEQARLSMEEARKVLEYSTGKRLDLLNEFRAQAADESKKYVTQETFDALSARMLSVEKSRDKMHGAILLLGVIGVATLVKLFW